MKMMQYLALGAFLISSCGVSNAWWIFGRDSVQRSHDTVFVNAVKNRQYCLANQELPYSSQKACDKAIREAARNSDIMMFNNLVPFATSRGYKKAYKSLDKHVRKTVRKFVPNAVVYCAPIATAA